MSTFAPVSRPSCRTLLRAFGRFCQPALRRGVQQAGADHYVKRYGSVGFALAWVAYFLLQLRSLRELTVRLRYDRRLQQLVGWGRISVAQLNRLHHDRPAALGEPLVAQLIARVQRRVVPSALRLLDTSFFSMSTKLLKRRYPQKRMRPGTAGVKLGTVLDPASWLPLRVVSRVGQDWDTGWLDDLVPPGEPVAGLLFIFDRGFRQYAFFERLIVAGAQFLTRATAQIHYEVVRARPLRGAPPEILSDELVILGSHNAHNRMHHPVRRIVLQTWTRARRHHPAAPLSFLTSDLETPAAELCELDRRRWEIENFFRWFKRTIGCVRPRGYSAPAAAHTFYAALVTFLLLLLLYQPASATPAPPPSACSPPFSRSGPCCTRHHQTTSCKPSSSCETRLGAVPRRPLPCRAVPGSAGTLPLH